MQILSSLYTVFALAVAALAETPAPPTELVIDRTHIPTECSVTAKKGDAIQVHYKGTLFANGNKFDSSYDRGSPLPLTLGIGQVIKGWDQGLIGMCVGEKRTLTIPSDMAYGSQGFGGIIPANSALVFDTELVSLESKHTEL